MDRQGSSPPKSTSVRMAVSETSAKFHPDCIIYNERTKVNKNQQKKTKLNKNIFAYVCTVVLLQSNQHFQAYLGNLLRCGIKVNISFIPGYGIRNFNLDIIVTKTDFLMGLNQ